MSKLYKLKEWFSLEDTAKRLSTSLCEQITVNDMIRLALGGHFPLSWHARYVAAQRVGQVCSLIYLLNPHLIFGENELTGEYHGEVLWQGDQAFRKAKRHSGERACTGKLTND